MDKKSTGAIKLLSLAVLFCLFCVGYGVVLLSDKIHALSEKVDESESRIGRLEDSLVGFGSKGKETRPLSGDGSTSGLSSTRQFDRRIALLERQFANIPAEPMEMEVDESAGESEDAVLPPENETSVSGRISDVYTEEITKSDWGIAAEDHILDAFEFKSFFVKYGGDLNADCRQSTCKVEWIMPDLDKLPPTERERMLGIAKYELLALVAENSTDTGRIDVDARLEGDQLVMIVFFRRAGQQSF